MFYLFELETFLANFLREKLMLSFYRTILDTQSNNVSNTAIALYIALVGSLISRFKVTNANCSPLLQINLSPYDEGIVYFTKQLSSTLLKLIISRIVSYFIIFTVLAETTCYSF